MLKGNNRNMIVAEESGIYIIEASKKEVEALVNVLREKGMGILVDGLDDIENFILTELEKSIGQSNISLRR